MKIKVIRTSKKDSGCIEDSNHYETASSVNTSDPPECAWEIQKDKPKFKHILSFAIILSAIIIAAAIVYVAPRRSESDIKAPEIVTISTLQKIVNISNLSTVKFVYNGSTGVSNGDKTDYYVSYKSIVSVGVDFSKITMEKDPVENKIYVNVPSPDITDISVDIESLDFIFTNKKADKLSVLQTAYEKCIEDVKNECKSEENAKMFALAKKGVEDTIRALADPIIEQFSDKKYKIIFDDEKGD